jgi:hypothetical protein
MTQVDLSSSASPSSTPQDPDSQSLDSQSYDSATSDELDYKPPPTLCKQTSLASVAEIARKLEAANLHALQKHTNDTVVSIPVCMEQPQQSSQVPLLSVVPSKLLENVAQTSGVAHAPSKGLTSYPDHPSTKFKAEFEIDDEEVTYSFQRKRLFGWFWRGKNPFQRMRLQHYFEKFLNWFFECCPGLAGRLIFVLIVIIVSIHLHCFRCYPETWGHFHCWISTRLILLRLCSLDGSGLVLHTMN